MEKNNGKIAIAIVAMFVVALSIVGFTYAYFVANVQGNEGDNSVTVTAGILEIEYKNVESKTLNVTGIAPGWKSDGLHYFDSASGCKAVSGQLQCTALKAENANAIPEGATGVNGPAEFTVSTSGRNTGTVNYVILLNGITNNLDDADKANLTYALCKDTCPATEEYTSANLTGDAVISKGEVVGKDVVKVVSGAETLNDGGSQKYQLMLYYANNGIQNSKGKTVSATVDVIGVQQDTNGNWVDANGVIVIAKNA